MSGYTPGGRRRIDRVLAPGFSTDLRTLGSDELRDRLTDAEQEEADLSFNRRMLQGRIDLLVAEQDRRVADTGRGPELGTRSDADIVAALAAVLADDRPETPVSRVRHSRGEPSRVGEHRRDVEVAVADVRVSDPDSLDDAALAEVLAWLRALERRVSDNRREVLAVVDELSTEVADRVAAGAMSADFG